MKIRKRPVWTSLPALTLAVGLPLTPGCSNGGQSGDLSEDALGKKQAQDQHDAGPTEPASDDSESDAESDAESNQPEPTSGDTESTPSSSASSARWEKLPAPPLSGRVSAVVASIEQQLVVVGGWSATCPPFADCVLPDTPPFADGARYDLDLGEWTPIADAPLGLRSATTVTAGDMLYALSDCGEGPSCPSGGTVLRYRSGADAWDQLPHPDPSGYFGLLAVADEIFAFSYSDESETVPDYRWLPGEDRWLALPDDPLPPVYDRFMVEHAGRVYLFGSPLAVSDEDTKLAASYDPETDVWEELTPSGTQGFQVWGAGELLYLNPHFSSAGGGIYDPERDVWSPWPDLPHHDLAGIIGEDDANYEYPDGWVFDTRDGAYLEIEPRPDASEVYDVMIARAGALGLVVFGGQRWVSDDEPNEQVPSGEVQLLNDTWLWTPPARQ